MEFISDFFSIYKCPQYITVHRLLFILFNSKSHAKNDKMSQAFHWTVPICTYIYLICHIQNTHTRVHKFTLFIIYVIKERIIYIIHVINISRASGSFAHRF